ncbi:MAG: hypothetical protein E6Q24_21250 [Chitinophagaceae bacterium]|nr:MAG: hypothetical protein E6Q24_21250 [Chitinophagaceae bacterium]
MNSPQSFAALIKAASYHNKAYTELVSLTNITFFLGAGFSKSWDASYPTGAELFSFKPDDYSDDLNEFVENIGLDPMAELDISKFKDIAYQLSMQKKYPTIMSRYIDHYNIRMIENELSAVITKRFQAITKLNYIDNAKQKLKLPDNPTEAQKDIVEFFRWINNHSTGDNGLPEGLRSHFITTNYDFLIETLLDAILADDDTHLLYTYRGFTPTTINSYKKLRTVFKHYLVQSLIKINGGFEIYANEKGFNVDYTKKTEAELQQIAPVLILPNREQDYTGDYFQTIFPKAIRTLQESKILIIVGYSLPEEDALLRILIRQFAEENVDGSEKVIFYIDRMPEAEQKTKLESVFPYHSTELDRYHIFTYSGIFSDWVKEVLAHK